MNEDEHGVTPANVTAMSVQRDGDLWWVIIEQGNGDVIKEVKLSDMERVMLAALLGMDAAAGAAHLDFVDSGR